MRRIGLFSLALAAGLLALPGAGAQAPAIGVAIELAGEFYYAGDPLSVRISVRNLKTETVPNPVSAPLFSAFKVARVGGDKLNASGKPSADEPMRPEQLAPASFYGATLNLAELYPELSAPGSYEIYWSSEGTVSNMATVTVISRFDPAKRYKGSIDTELGPITIEFYQQESPIAVKSFIDMARAGFYDGLLFQEVQANSYVIGGDSRFGPTPRRPINFPAEQSALPLVAGTVIVKPVGAAPPTNGPEFIILLRPQPAWSGQVTVLGQVVKGLDLVQKISRVPQSGPVANPKNKPLEDVRIRTISIEAIEATPASTVTSG